MMDPQTGAFTHSWTTEILFYSSLTLSLTLLIKYLLRRSVPANIPPFPAKAYPILGHLPYIKTELNETLEKWRKSTGDIFSLYFGPQLVVILNSYDAAYEAFVTNGDTLSERPNSSSVNTGDEESKLGILSTSGQTWREQRTATVQILRSFGMGKNTFAVKVSEEVSVYIESLSQLSGKPINPRMLTNTAVANIICSIIVGKRFEYDDDYFIKFLHMINEQIALSSSSSLFSIFPWLRHLPGDMFNAKRRIGSYKNLMTFFCDHYIKKSEEEYDENNLNNFIDAYLLKMKNGERQGKHTGLDKKNLRRVLFDLFVAGIETTAFSMMWFFVNILRHPDVQEKIYREIISVVGTERAVTMHDKTNLNYTYAAIMESLRRSNLGALGPPHSAKEDTIVKGFTIPAQTMIMTNIDSVLFDDKNFKDPLEFIPERFLDAQGKFTQPEEFLAFGLGRRQCPGESLAKMELFLFLTSIIQRFEMQPAVPGEHPSMEFVPGIVCPPKPFQLRFVDRLRN